MKKTSINLNLKNFSSDHLVDGISSHFFLRHFPVVILVVFFALGYISVRFDCVTAMETVSSLTHRLEVARTETQRERALYMSATCERSMQQMVDTLHLGLNIQERPPYKITYDNGKD